MADAEGARLFVRLTPRAAGERIDGLAPDGDGRLRLRVSVTAPPEAGKANAALIALLARSWRLPKGAFTLVAGSTDRRKTLRLDTDPAAIEDVTRRLADLPRR